MGGVRAAHLKLPAPMAHLTRFTDACTRLRPSYSSELSSPSATGSTLGKSPDGTKAYPSPDPRDDTDRLRWPKRACLRQVCHVRGGRQWMHRSAHARGSGLPYFDRTASAKPSGRRLRAKLDVTDMAPMRPTLCDRCGGGFPLLFAAGRGTNGSPADRARRPASASALPAPACGCNAHVFPVASCTPESKLPRSDAMIALCACAGR